MEPADIYGILRDAVTSFFLPLSQVSYQNQFLSKLNIFFHQSLGIQQWLLLRAFLWVTWILARILCVCDLFAHLLFCVKEFSVFFVFFFLIRSEGKAVNDLISLLRAS